MVFESVDKIDIDALEIKIADAWTNAGNIARGLNITDGDSDKVRLEIFKFLLTQLDRM
ncbi:MAG TPA: hypothetical protein VMY59_01025 [Candidatus Thermoplasmatota archaeon]|nr:hypothetical protein [Candidatus Thermoplasmatota archaeon]